MTSHIVGVRSSVFPGLVLAFTLLGFVGMLVFQLVSISAESSLFANLTTRDWDLLVVSTTQALLSTLLSLSVGISVAWALYYQASFPGRNLLVTLFSTALVLPTLIVVLGLVTVLGRSGWINDLLLTIGTSTGGFLYGLAGILIAHTYLNGSFAVRALLNRMEGIPAEKQKLARSLDLSVWQRFKWVEWPAIKTTLPGIGAIIFLLCFTSFAIVLTLGGSPRNNTLEVAIYEAVKLDFDIPHALDLAFLQLMICAALVFAAAGYRTQTRSVSKSLSLTTRWADGPAVQFVQRVIVLLATVCFVLPLIAITLDGLVADFPKLIAEASFRKAFATSILLATASSFFTVAIAVLMAAARRNFTLPTRLRNVRNGTPFASLISFSTSLYLAFPSLVLALGMFVVARKMPGSLNSWAIVAVLLANVLMALPFAISILVPAFEKTGFKYDRLCFSVALTPTAKWRLCEWPLLKKDVLYVAAIAFCFSFGDLGVIALFGSQDFATLPWYLYQKMGSYRTDDAAGIALIMLGIILFVFFILPWIADRLDRDKAGAHAAR